MLLLSFCIVYNTLDLAGREGQLFVVRLKSVPQNYLFLILNLCFSCLKLFDLRDILLLKKMLLCRGTFICCRCSFFFFFTFIYIAVLQV